MTESTDPPQASSEPSVADEDGPQQHPQGDGPSTGVEDSDLPEDLQPGDDNPLAEPLDPDAEDTKDPDELDMTATQDDDAAAGEPDPDAAGGGSQEDGA